MAFEEILLNFLSGIYLQFQDKKTPSKLKSDGVKLKYQKRLFSRC